MSNLDLLILVALLGGALRGFWTGVIRQVASLVGFVVAFALAVQLMTPVGALVVDSLGLSERLGPALGFLVVFLAVQAVVFAVARLVETTVGVLRLGLLDKLAGGAFGGLKAALLLSVLFLVLGTFGTPSRETRQASRLYRPVASVLPETWNFVTEQWPEAQALSQKFRVPLPFEGNSGK